MQCTFETRSLGSIRLRAWMTPNEIWHLPTFKKLPDISESL